MTAWVPLATVLRYQAKLLGSRLVTGEVYLLENINLVLCGNIIFCLSRNDVKQVEKCIEDGELCKLLRLPDELDDFSEVSIIKSIEFFIK